MGGFGKRLLQKFQRSAKQTNRDLSQDAQTPQAETNAEQELGKLSSGVRRESAILVSINKLYAAKITRIKLLVKKNNTVSGLQVAKKRATSAMRIITKQMGQNMQRTMYTGVGKVQGPLAAKDPKKVIANMQEEQRKLIAQIASETALEIQQMREEAAEEQPVIEINSNLKETLRKYQLLLDEEDTELQKARDELLAAIRAETQNQQKERQASTRQTSSTAPY